MFQRDTTLFMPSFVSISRSCHPPQTQVSVHNVDAGASMRSVIRSFPTAPTSQAAFPRSRVLQDNNNTALKHPTVQVPDRPWHRQPVCAPLRVHRSHHCQAQNHHARPTSGNDPSFERPEVPFEPIRNPHVDVRRPGPSRRLETVSHLYRADVPRPSVAILTGYSASVLGALCPHLEVSFRPTRGADFQNWFDLLTFLSDFDHSLPQAFG
jgi:hypothetical protein